MKLYEHQKQALKATADKNISETRIYKIWETMKNRCYCTGQTSYKHYGGRGITVCDKWRHNFQEFYNWAMSNGYSEELTLDRINNDGNYEPDNCRWVTMKEQCRNKSSNRLLSYKGKTQCLSDWAAEIGIDRRTIAKRIDKLGWTIEKALSTPVNGGGSYGTI